MIGDYMSSSTIIGLLNFSIAIVGIVFAYYKFFREGSHHQRIECDIDFINLGVNGNHRIVELGITAENKGNIEQKFDQILLKIRGIKEDQELHELKNNEPRLCFPEKLSDVSVISKKYKYFFVRPRVRQRFSVVVKIPSNWSQLHARSTFKYLGTNQIHTTERAFMLLIN